MWQAIRQWFLDPAHQAVVAIAFSFAAGLLLGRAMNRRNTERASFLSDEGGRAFFKGVEHILSNDHDQAIEQFTRAVQLDSDTIETYVALGNLYRSKGDIDRAIRIRQNIILRPNINERQRNRALFDLGVDYRRGGFLGRAVRTFGELLQKEPSNVAALEEVEKIHEDLRDWENAFQARQRIARLVKGNHAHILAHHKTEEGKAWFEKDDASKAKSAFKKAISIDSSCVDAYLHLGDLYRAKEDFKKAVAAWKRIADVSPALTFLAYRRLEGAYAGLRDPGPVEEFLRDCSRKSPDAFTHLALGRFLYSGRDIEGAVRELRRALELNPSFWEARTLLGAIYLGEEMKTEALEAYRDLIDHLDVSSLEFQCSRCGYRPSDLQWQCPQCRRWDTIGRMDAAEGNAAVEQTGEPVRTLPERFQQEVE